MKKLKSTATENLTVISAFFLTALICLTIYILRGVSPFGDGSILKVDLFHQYAPFLEELRSRILNGENLFYSWETGLGKDFITQVAYYTSSPLDFLVLLSPRDKISEFVAFLIALKISLAGASFTAYLKKHFQTKHFSIVMFGLMYAFCGFLSCYYWNIMWIDTVALFPLLALGVDALVKEDKHIQYYVCLTLTMIVNFYLAVLVCVFITLYYLLTLIANTEWKRYKNIYIQRTLKFGVISILSALSAMFILLPVAIALRQTTVSTQTLPEFKVYHNIFQLLTCHFLGARPAVLARNEDLPNVFSGVLTMILLPVYFTNTKILKKEKVLYAIVVVFTLLCCCIAPMDFMIHGFHYPANLPHRFTFIYSFLLLTMAYKAFINLKHCNFKWITLTNIVYIVVILVSEYLVVPLIHDIEVTLSTSDVCINVSIICFYLAILYLMKDSKAKTATIFTSVLFVGIIGECIFSSYDGMDYLTDPDKYVAYIDGTDDAMEYIDSQDDDLFYRTEFRRLNVVNEGNIYHYNGFSQFSSLAPGGISAFIKKLGVASTGNSYRYYDPTPLVNAIFNMKYLLNRDSELKNAEHYNYLGQFGDNVYAYENTRVLPLGFLVDSSVKNWNLEESNPFIVQNDFIKTATSTEEDMFTLLKTDYVNIENMQITENEGDNNFDYELIDPTNLSLIPKVTAQITSAKDQYLYLYVSADNADRFVYHTNREEQDRELACGNSIIDIGYVSEGEVITIEFSVTKRGKFETTYRRTGSVKLYAASYNDSVFQSAYDELVTQGMTLTSFEDTHIEGVVNAKDNQLLFLSIPYVDGWTIMLDGEKVEKTSISDNGLLALDIPAGQHIVTLTYKLKGFEIAILASVFGIFMFVVYNYFDHKYSMNRR